MDDSQTDLVVEISLDLADGMEIPDVLLTSVARHRGNIIDLYRNLRRVGMDDETVKASLSGVIDSYKAELLNALITLRSNA